MDVDDFTDDALSGGWFQCPVEAWEEARESIVKPWSLACAIADLRWHEDQVKMGLSAKIPGYRVFMKRWGMGERAVRNLMSDEARWSTVAPKVSTSAHLPQPCRTSAAKQTEQPRKSPETSAPLPQFCRTSADTRVSTQTADTDTDPSLAPGGLFPDAPALRRALAVKEAHAERIGWLDSDDRLRQQWPVILSKMPAGLDIELALVELDDWLLTFTPKRGQKANFAARLRKWVTGPIAIQQAARNMEAREEEQRRKRHPSAQSVVSNIPTTDDGRSNLLRPARTIDEPASRESGRRARSPGSDPSRTQPSDQ